MKQLKTSLYKAIASILASDNIEFKSARNILLFSQVLSTYPSKSIYALTSHRILSFLDRNILKPELMIDIMKEEGEDEELINTITQLREKPAVTTSAEVTQLCMMFSDYIKYSRILKVKDSFIQTLDVIDSEEDPNRETMRQLYNIAQDITEAYNYANITETSHTFDTNDKDGMKQVVAETKDARSSDKVIITGVRGLNMLLSPGYLGGYLYIYTALPGCYKSGILLKSHIDTLRYNEHLKNITNGKIPVSIYISMENTMTQTVRRLWALLYPTADMSMFSIDEITDMIDQALTEKGMRSVILYYGYREKSTRDISNIIQSYNTDKTEVVALYFDYIKRVRPSRTDQSINSEKAELNAITNEFKYMAAQFNIPVVTGHQLNRAAAIAVDEIAKSGGFNKTEQGLNRGNISVAWEVMENADWIGLMNIENHGDNKVLVCKAGKQRDKDDNADLNIIGIKQPFLSPTSFALRDDILENVPICEYVYEGKQRTNYMAQNI